MKITLKSTGDTIEIYLFQKLKALMTERKQHLFFSTSFKFYFNSFKEYWIEIGKRDVLIELISKSKSKGIHGFSFEEMLQRFATSEFGVGTGVILFNINTYTLGRMLDRFNGIDASLFNEDYVAIPMDSREQARKLISKLPQTLCEAYAFDRGFIFHSNNGENE